MHDAYDIVVIDLDGTLLRSDGTISPADRRAVAEARAAGLEVLIATGRALPEAVPALEAIEHDGLVITAGGAMLSDLAAGMTRRRRPMCRHVVAGVVNRLIANGHKALILKDADVTGYDYLAIGPHALDPASQWWFDQLDVAVRFIDHVDEDEHPEDTVRAAAVAGCDELAPLADQLHTFVGNRACLQHWSAVTESEAIGSTTHLLEVFDRDVNKWTMVRTHCRELGVDPRRTVAIGDGLNDVELVRQAGLGVAMANADARVLGVAQRVTASNDENGVAGVLDGLLSGAW